MRATRASVFLLCLLQLAGCTSADVALRKPQALRADDAREEMPPVLPRPMPQVNERPVKPIPRPAPVTIAPAQPVGPQAPVPVTSCDPGGCWGPDNRYQAGAGNTYLDRNGRLCQGNGAWMQCF